LDAARLSGVLFDVTSSSCGKTAVVFFRDSLLTASSFFATLRLTTTEARMLDLKPHPAAELFPMMSDTDLAALTADIEAHGQREPIVLHKGLILDGRHRYAACQKLGVEPRTMEWAGRDDADEIEAYVNSLNLHRRHLTESQRAMIAARRANMRQGARTDLQPSANLPEVSQEEAAKRYHVSERSVRDAAAVQRKAAPELAKAVDKAVDLRARRSPRS